MKNVLFFFVLAFMSSGLVSCQKCGYCYYRNASNPQLSYSGEEVCGQPEYDEAESECDIGNDAVQRWIPN
jgi:hypothetical protein